MKARNVFALTFLAAFSIGGMTGCRSSKNRITIWTFSDELQEIADTYYDGNANVIIKGSVAIIICVSDFL